VGVLVLAAVNALDTFGPGCGGRPAGTGSRTFGVLLLTLPAFGACAVWRYLGAGCPMEGCT
jgi:hypothetical protein